MLDIVIPTCDKDHEQAQTLLRSLDAFAAPDLVASLCLVCVDEPRYFDRMRELRAYTLQPRTRYLHLSDLGLPDFIPGLGWFQQQLVKLRFAHQTASPFYLVLDSKNIVVQPVAHTDLIREGRAAAVLEDVAIHRRWWEGSARLLRHPGFDRTPGRPALSAGTPVLMHAASVVSMMRWVEEASAAPFVNRFMCDHLIDRDCFATEFSLYYVYLDREHLFDRLHFRNAELHDGATALWTGVPEPEQPVRLRRLLEGTEHTGRFTCIQRAIWQGIDRSTRDAILQQRGSMTRLAR